ncbi:MAG: hypothetical protein HQL13_06445 [Candidatus Omnitrophica bacterium]|nr:hypothetical protein [Candidatus Omnitrophota bacterium]
MDIKNFKLPATKDWPMKDIIHKSASILHGQGKSIVIREHAQDDQCVTDVRKNFIYVAQEADSQEEQAAPKVRIKKSFDSVNKDEKFSFRVIGHYYVTHHRRLIKIIYAHTLKINLHWKCPVTSLKKIVTMA